MTAPTAPARTDRPPIEVSWRRTLRLGVLLGRLQPVLVDLEFEDVVGVPAVVGPQRRLRDPDAVQPYPAGAVDPVGLLLRVEEHRQHPFDHADVPADVDGGPHVPGSVTGGDPHALTDLEPGGHGSTAQRRRTSSIVLPSSSEVISPFSMSTWEAATAHRS